MLPNTYSITASYGGDGNFTGSTSAGLPQVVNKAMATTTVTTSGPSVYGQPVTLTATISPPAGSPIPTGSVTFFVMVGSNLVQLNSTPAGLGTTGGVTSTSYTTTIGQLPVGTDTITAIYSGDSHYASTTGTTTQSVSQDNTTTIVTSSGPVSPGETATITADLVANSPGGGIAEANGETVTFTVGGTTLGTGTLSTTNGVTTASITVSGSTPGLTVGPNAITATYGGDADFIGSQGTVSEGIEDLTSTNVLISPSPSVFGQSVTLKATITPNTATGITPTGTVTFVFNNTILGTATVGSVGGGTATALLPVTSLPVSTNASPDMVTAFYSGDSTFIGSQGTAIQVVSKDSTKTTLSTTAAAVEAGEYVIFTAQVAALSPGQGVPTGTVTFKNGTVPIGTATVVNGTATLQHAMMNVGNNQITAVYSGDSNDLASTSAILVETVAKVGTRASTVTVASSNNPSTFGQSVTFTATVRDAGAGAIQTPAGSVSFFEGTTLIGYGALKTSSNGVAKATFTTSTLPQGIEKITAMFNGNASFAQKSSSPLVQTVKAIPTRSSDITLIASSSTTTFGTPVTFTATVTDLGSGTAETPTGTVTFTATSTAPGSNPISVWEAGTLSAPTGFLDGLDQFLHAHRGHPITSPRPTTATASLRRRAHLRPPRWPTPSSIGSLKLRLRFDIQWRQYPHGSVLRPGPSPLRPLSRPVPRFAAMGPRSGGLHEHHDGGGLWNVQPHQWSRHDQACLAAYRQRRY